MPSPSDAKTAALRGIHNTLVKRGYRRISGITGHGWEGTERIGGRDIELVIGVFDVSFSKLPVIALKNPDTKIRAHVLRGGAICYAADASLVLDPTDPGGSILRCIEQAIHTLSISGTEANSEIRAEFATYWNGAPVLTDLQDGGGNARVFSVPRGDGMAIELFATSAVLPKFLAERFGTRFQTPARATVVELCTDLDVRGAAFPPEDLAETLDWLQEIAPENVNHVLKALTQETMQRVVLLVGQNATVGVSLEYPPDIQRMMGDGFRKNTWRNEVRRRLRDVKVKRYTCHRGDESYRLGRNLNQMASLRDRRIAQIGVGAIGGYLAQALTRVGAGSGPQGTLGLFDPDNLYPSNLGRHLLSAESLLKPKAESLALRLMAEAPGLKVTAHVVDGLDCIEQLQGYELIVDATGEERVAFAFNEIAQQYRRADGSFPPILHSWLTGNGASTQAFLNGLENKACLRCLRPDLRQPGRYWPLKPGVGQDLRIPADGCGGAYVPYAISAPMIAAGLAVEVALGWASGDPHPTLRTLNIDQDLTTNRRNLSPDRHPGCPSCK